ncbi:hypothetical protein PVAP13_8KG164103 [Panicum virgatum]|uniref:Uncharacterized protein n=1 Tax=Panicum virgatum TaxID=38727 RepID=A0A8T0PHQ8_PANVG|nr:hypothetical protein PVAP13_8KG164103 [Panicum virgatum]
MIRRAWRAGRRRTSSTSGSGCRMLQRRCGPGTEPYLWLSEQLRSGQMDADNVDICSHLRLISYREPDAFHGRRGTASCYAP